MLPYALTVSHRVLDVTPKLVFEDGQATGEQATNPDGLPLWAVSVKLFYTDAEGDPASTKVKVTVPARHEPSGLIGQQAKFTGLEIGAVSGNFYFRAYSVEPAESLSDLMEEGQQ